MEINTSFYRAHRIATYERWARSVPDHFRFSLKVPKTITHERRLEDCRELFTIFARETAALGEKRAVLLVQLPPSLTFDERCVTAFFAAMREQYAGWIACEPRHASWFEARAEALLRTFDVARVAADPPVVPAAAQPGASPAFAYYRRHGAPRVYYSAYGADDLGAFAESLDSMAPERWCIFDNTALGAATTDALALSAMLEGRATRGGRVP